MGARPVGWSTIAASAQEGFDQKVKEDSYEYGHGDYSGHVNGYVDLGRCMGRYDFVPTTERAKKTREKEVDKIIDDWMDNYGEKRVVQYIDNGIAEFVVVTAKKKPHKVTSKPKFSQFFVVVEGWEEKYEARFTTQKEAVDAMLKLALENPYKEYKVIKDYVRVSGDTEVATVEVTKKSYKKKPAKIPQGARLIELHEYIYFGYVPE